MPKPRRTLDKTASNSENKSAAISERPITRTLEENYMPYTMSVIISRAIPEIDGFKPAHRKLLYTMYKMGLLGGQRTKSANVVGQTMKLNPHGDMAIYETLVRLTRANEALLHPFIDSKGSFGKQYSKMAFAAARYTEVRLDSICGEIFSGIDKDAVDLVDNYDSTLKEPALLPTAFPNLLANPNTGIAVGIASNICSFNLGEIIDTTVALIRDPDHDIFSTLKAPDFSTGAMLLYNREQLEQVYRTGKGSVRLRSRYNYEKSGNLIEIKEIPYTTNIETIVDKIADLAKSGKLKEISDVRDETDLNGLKIAIDLKRGVDPDKLMKRLYKLTTLEDDFPCNFNILISGTPRLMGIKEIISEWHAFRCECLRRELYYDLRKKEEKLHMLRGLEKILLDIDKAIAIIRGTKNDREVVPNLAAGFDIDEAQAEYVAEIKLRNLNKEYILQRTADIERLLKEIADIEAILKSEKRLDNMIVKQLTDIKEKYAIPRKTEIIYEDALPAEDTESEPEIEDYPVYAVMTRDGYLKKISLASMRGNDEQSLKEKDEIVFSGEVTNRTEILFLSDRSQCYKARMSDFEGTKSSALGDFIPAKLGFDSGERVMFTVFTVSYAETLYILFENGKAVALSIETYKTKNNRKKLTNAYSDSSPVCAMSVLQAGEDAEFLIKTDSGRALVIKPSLIPLKSTRTSGGVQIIALKKQDKPSLFVKVEKGSKTLSKYMKLKVPSPGAIWEDQISLDQEKQ